MIKGLWDLDKSAFDLLSGKIVWVHQAGITEVFLNQEEIIKTFSQELDVHTLLATFIGSISL